MDISDSLGGLCDTPPPSRPKEPVPPSRIRVIAWNIVSNWTGFAMNVAVTLLLTPYVAGGGPERQCRTLHNTLDRGPFHVSAGAGVRGPDGPRRVEQRGYRLHGGWARPGR